MPSPVPASPAVRAASVRAFTALVGVWLLISAFSWDHTYAERTTAWVVAVLTMVFSLLAIAVSTVRYVVTLAALWLFFSSWAFPTVASGTIWNNVTVAVVLFLLSLVSSPTEGERNLLGRFGPPEGAEST